MRRAAVIVVTALAVAAPAGAVSGGRAAPIAKTPFVVYLGNCTGSLIAPDRILTAAHCVDGLHPRGLPVLVGVDPSRNHDAVHQTLAVRGYSIAPGYRLAFPFSHRSPSSAIAIDDVALVVLEQPVAGVTPVRIATAADRASK